MTAYKPKIVGFLCNWCSYAASDAAGGKRASYPPEFTVVRVMCSGRVEAQMVLKAFAEGADAVAIFGCHPGDCHYQEGNHKAMRRHQMLKAMLNELDIEKERLRLEWISAAEADRFIDVVREMYDEVAALGPRKSTPVVQAEG